VVLNPGTTDSKEADLKFNFLYSSFPDYLKVIFSSIDTCHLLFSFYPLPDKSLE
jgi:hypothetical protein